MHVTTIDHWAPEPGTVLTWDVRAPETSRGPAAPLTLNQRNHLRAAASGQPSVWLTAAFEVPGPIDAVALQRAFGDFVARHETLHCTTSHTGDDVAATRHDPDALEWSLDPPRATDDTDTTRALLRRSLDRRCRPFHGPAFLPAAVSRPSGSTVVLGFDHVHADAHSLVVAVTEMPELYAARCEGRDVPAELAPVAARPGGDGELVAPDDPRLLAWQEFWEGQGHTLPVFPLPLGLEPGEQAAQATLVDQLLSAKSMAAVDARAHAMGVSAFSLALSAFATAVHGQGGPERLALLLPVNTRERDHEAHVLGWLTTSVPLVVRADGTDAGARGNGEDLRSALRLARVPLGQVIDSLPVPLHQERRDVFMVSWLDYRRLPGTRATEDRRPHHISSPTVADDVQVWLSRTDAGLALRARLPDTPVARATTGRLVDEWRALLTAPVGGS